MLRKCGVVAFFCLLLSAFPVQANAAGQRPPYFETSDCGFQIPVGKRVVCGDVTVLELHKVPAGRTIKLHVAIFKAESRSPFRDPIIYLDGGPGGQTFTALNRRLPGFLPYMVDRDFILFDQRGIGLSQPALNCPEMLATSFAWLDRPLNSAQSGLAEMAAMRQCHDRLVKAGINLSAYNSAESATDVHDLQVALGYKSWNLYGVSYGTRLALITVRDFPDGIRSVVLDSTFPPDRAIDGSGLGDNASRAFNLLFDSCTKDPPCNTDYPGLRKVYNQLLSRLSKSPIPVNEIDPITGKNYTMLLDSNRVEEGIYLALYSRQIIPMLPAAITTAADGDYRLISSLAFRSYLVDEEISLGMYYAVDCADRLFPPVLCGLWGVQPNVPQKPKPVVSSIPTLVLAGQYDPITSPEFGATAAKTLKRSYYFMFPGFGHGVSVAGICPAQIMLQFLARPAEKPDSRCIARLSAPAWTSVDF
ncbi:MAG TPA: alpha/beta hydrolase [Aggregatilineales bacterium]|nr:alpha/beta hydrolase [Aggregatilineales bacterium]